ncbi:class A sortase [Lacticaseibacillus jixianensis]|uniref:Class A sortase n=1 Tax=Lacticaseibacillus jixianensis TaxID=2486012 RepID=A0ABW4BBG2_9LACO|nr:class A sortase [Lacticaseibacillus jixianensis]
MRRLVKWFTAPALVMLLSIALVAAGYQHLLQAPQTTISLGQAARQQANLRASRPVAEAKRRQIAEADLRTLTVASGQTARLVKRAGVGRVAVPSVGISLPIYNQINDNTLSTGTAMYYPERRLGRGNTALVAHHYLQGSGLLNALNHVKRGATILASDLNTVWTYRVAVNQVVSKDQVSVLTDTSDARITLIRCEGPRGTTLRRVVIGLLVSRAPLKQTAQAKPLGVTTHQPSKKPATPVTLTTAALARTVAQRRLDGWLWGLVLVNLVLLLGCSAGYVFAKGPRRPQRPR